MIDLLYVIIDNVIPFLLVLTPLVFIHEMGHFLVARWAGVKVETFAVGFGREIFGFNDRHGTRWKFCWIPLGGYVKMFGDMNAASLADPDAEEMSEAEKQVAFPHKPLAWRAAVVAAGPIANFILAIVLFTGVFMVSGVRMVDPVVGSVDAGGAAELAGFQAGDRIVAVDGKPIRSFNDFALDEQILVEQALRFTVERGGDRLEIPVVPERREVITPRCRTTRINDLGLNPLVDPASTVIGGVSRRSIADRAGLKRGDRIIAVDGTAVSLFSEISPLIAGQADQLVKIEFERRNGERAMIEVAPERTEVCAIDGTKQTIGLLGISPASVIERTPLGPIEALSRAFSTSWDMVVGTLRTVWQMITRDRGTEELGGPIGIAGMVGNAANTGLVALISFAAILSLNLGLINLFPIPVLDGGHLAMYGYEAVRGKPLGPRAQDIAFRVGFALIISLMLFATANDILRGLS